MAREAHPSLPEFDYIKPNSLAEASQFLADHPGKSRPLLGGTDIFVRLRDGVWKENEFLVDVKGLDGTDQIAFNPASGLTIGAAVNMNRISGHPDVKEHYSLLAEACDTVAAYQLRNRATVVGNICNASPAGDTIGSCLLYGGELTVHGVDGVRKEPLENFFKGPGKTNLKPGDVVTALFLPIPPKGFIGRYIKLNRNKRGDLAIVGVTAASWMDKSVNSGLKIRMALASVAPVPLVVTAIEDFFNENELNADTVVQGAKIAMDSCTPIDDVRGTAKYRKMMVRNLAKQALSSLLEERS